MKTLLAFSFLIILIPACTNPGKAPESTYSDIFMDMYGDSLTQEINEQTQLGYLHGFAVVIASNQGVLYQKGFGSSDFESSNPYTENSLQNIGSISKTFIGIALLKAQEMNMLRLDDAVNDYLPFRVVNPHHPEVPITFRHLATHTSTIIDTDAYEYSYIFQDTLTHEFPDSVLSLAGYLENILNQGGEWYTREGFLDRAPGEMFEYSNLGAALAALGLENATGISFPEFTNTYILNPLNMSSSGWFLEDIETSMHATVYADLDTPVTPYYLITYPDGGLITSATDMGKYLVEIMLGFAGEGRLLSAESYGTIFTPQLDDSHFAERDSTFAYNDEYNSGIFMGFSGTGNVGHTGSDPGIIAAMFFNPENQTGFYFMTNTEITSEEAFNELMEIVGILEKYGSRAREELVLR
jgi:CubicO group peptidase (beta-lactamase class C family)